MKIVSIVGARPNFMKVAPVLSALRSHGHDALLVHTGQHYDRQMSEVFFEELEMPRPDVNLGVGSASHAVQTARIMEAFEPVALQEKPDVVLVAGDVNSTVACALVAIKLGVPVAHLEAGLRSHDWRMPEEINRVLTDRISAILLTPSRDADENLRREGAPERCIHFVGNAMIDSLRRHVDKARSLSSLERHGKERRGYALVTLHRPSNVDERPVLGALLEVLARLSAHIPVLFPAHPRTMARVRSFGLEDILRGAAGIRVLEPLSYLEFLALEDGARMVLTDSGGIQEETTALGVPCLTLRENTERPITCSEGTNTIVGTDPARVLGAALELLERPPAETRSPELWDGRTGDRVATLFDGFEATGLPWR